MNRPRFGYFVIGHPIALLLATVLILFGIYRWTQDSTSWPLTVIGFGFMGLSSNASDKVEQYRRWKRAWEDMDGRPPKSSGRLRKSISFLAGIVCVLVAFNVVAKPQRPLVIYGACAVIGSILVWRLMQRLLRRIRTRRAETVDSVSVCIQKSVLPVPSLEQAFNALPAHCHSVLRANTSGG